MSTAATMTLLDRRAVVFNSDDFRLRIQPTSQLHRDQYLAGSLPNRKRRQSDTWDLFIQKDGNGLCIKRPEEKPDGHTFIGRLDLERLGFFDGYRRRNGKLAEVYVSKPLS
ncbi:hypothetical protein QBC43DRAFT_284994 [Cladorrhinum sp. PSN259]|nr:hypothetical protein QBC43DRAFT_284994 [Cladorrhinum sp. PSN259]